ncbi:testis-expressed protein 2-like isoform X1 [Anolis sagrei]|uniref:testis-expressed protein 2-like isoform X1 n=1 Tax=Anolis sagrei TaxID=38937 RepID=UPI0035213138
MADRPLTVCSLLTAKPSLDRQRSEPLLPQTFAGPIDGSRKDEEWESVHGNELIFALDEEEDVVLESPGNLPPGEEEIRKDENQLAEPSMHAASLLPSPKPVPQGPKPLINLVKSISTEIEAREGSPAPKPQPLLSLVKSISTEISRLEPEVTPSKSDSKLNVHRWRQITHPKGKNGDSRTAPSSPNVSPSESRGSFFKAQEAKFEDTKRRFSEAMQEPLSRLSKIIGEENVSPKHKALLNNSQDSASSHGKESTVLESSSPEMDHHGATAKGQMEGFGLAEPKWSPSSNCRYEICSYGDLIQVVEVGAGAEEVRTVRPLDAVLHPTESCSSVPSKALACVALLAYNYFVLPLPPYVSGLCLGLASGFLLGFLVILLLVPKRTRSPRKTRALQDVSLLDDSVRRQLGDSNVLKVREGWMNQMYFYDPEIYHPSLTHSVFVTLEDSSMTLSYPKNNIPRRATFEEEIFETTFVNHRQYEMTGAQVFLSPPALARKRMWNKKYPICVLFPDPSDMEADPAREKGARKRPVLGQEAPAKPVPEAPERTLYLFGRTGRSKEEWFQHFARASRLEGSEALHANLSEPQSGVSPSGKAPHSESSGSSSSRGSTEDLPAALKPKELAVSLREKLLLDYGAYMSRVVPPASEASPTQSPCPSAASSPDPKRIQGEANLTGGPPTAWVNAVLGRIFWDFLREKYWADQVSNKIQKKLGRIKLPYFMNELTLTELDMGDCIPHIMSASSPTVDSQGLWVDMEVTYTGSLQMTLETKMNLYKLGKDASGEESGRADHGSEGVRPRLVLLADSEAESSSAGSSEEEDAPPSVETSLGGPGERGAPPGMESHLGGHSTSRKILRFVDKIAKSKYFQKATENEFIKKKIEEVSNTPLLLTVEVQELTGTLTVNIPPPPTDRVWYSFRIPPQLDLKVRPKLGEREVTFIHVTEWIEKKLQHEFQKVLVMPNMDDLILPLMHSGLESQAFGDGSQKDSHEEVLKSSPMGSKARI